jgi:hypothetical protein
MARISARRGWSQEPAAGDGADQRPCLAGQLGKAGADGRDGGTQNGQGVQEQAVAAGVGRGIDLVEDVGLQGGDHGGGASV